MRAWNTRHLHKIPEKKEKGPVEPEKGKEKETDELELFFCHLFEFHNPVPDAPAFVPAVLPPRLAIDFVPAAPDTPVFTSPVAASAVPSPVSTGYSVISSAPIVSSTCIESNT